MDQSFEDNTHVSIFSGRVFERSAKLIDIGVWEGIDKFRLEQWIEGLRIHDRSDLLAACLLDNLIYRSKDQFKSLIRGLFLSNSSITEDDCQDDLISLLRTKNNGSVLAVPVIALHQPPTKSGPYVLRVSQRLFKFHDSNLKWPFDLHTVTERLKYLVCVDDFCGTGDTFVKFIKRNNIDSLHASHPHLKIIYFVAAAHETGITNIKKSFPYVDIYFSDYLTNKHNFFDGNIFDKYGTAGLCTHISKCYEVVNIKNNLSAPDEKYYSGYGGLGLTYAAYHSTPNNSLPIYWRGNDNWKPLLDR